MRKNGQKYLQYMPYHRISIKEYFKYDSRN